MIEVKIDRDIFERQIVEEKLTIPQLMEYWKCGRGTICNRKKEWGLKGKSPNSKVRDNGDGTKTCSSCNVSKDLSEFYSNGFSSNGVKKIKPLCKLCSTDSDRKRVTELLIDILRELNREYACEICGYDKNSAAIHFHHNTGEKNFDISSGKTFSRERLMTEIMLCQVLCSNCHAEVHNPQSKLKGIK